MYYYLITINKHK